MRVRSGFETDARGLNDCVSSIYKAKTPWSKSCLDCCAVNSIHTSITRTVQEGNPLVRDKAVELCCSIHAEYTQ